MPCGDNVTGSGHVRGEGNRDELSLVRGGVGGPQGRRLRLRRPSVQSQVVSKGACACSPRPPILDHLLANATSYIHTT